MNLKVSLKRDTGDLGDNWHRVSWSNLLKVTKLGSSRVGDNQQISSSPVLFPLHIAHSCVIVETRESAEGMCLRHTASS